jgi:hypothetical protein
VDHSDVRTERMSRRRRAFLGGAAKLLLPVCSVVAGVAIGRMIRPSQSTYPYATLAAASALTPNLNRRSTVIVIIVSVVLFVASLALAYQPDELYGLGVEYNVHARDLSDGPLTRFHSR